MRAGVLLQPSAYSTRTRTATAHIDCTAPVISNVQVSGVTGAEATITWDTRGKSMNVMTLEAWDDLEALVEDSYLRAIPVDPITESADTWIVEYAEMSEEDISTEPGIEDVKSGADGYGLDGSRYADW